MGTEILLGQIVDTNAALVGELYAELGIDHLHRQTVGDNLARIVEALELACSRSEIVFTIGGLGPTQDDLTRRALADATSDELILDDDVRRGLKQIFEERGISWTPTQEAQAFRPSRASVIQNTNGTAPGLICEVNNTTIIALPGPKNEFATMLFGPVREYLTTKLDGGIIHSRTIRVVGIPEATIDDRCADLIAAADPTVAPYAKTGEVHLRVTSRGESVAAVEQKLEPIISEISTRLGHHAYALDEVTLPARILHMLRDQGQTLGVVESCTGGGLGAALTSAPGSSDVFLGGLITYSNELKQSLALVDRRIIEVEGAVSRACAIAMAEGGRAALGVDWCASVTGIAGPGGGTEQKPVGTVFVAVASPKDTWCRRAKMRGGREDVRTRSVSGALLLLYEALCGKANREQ